MNTPLVYRFFIAMKAEIDRHKWIESEKAGYDIGTEMAIIDWMLKHKTGWKIYYMETQQPSSSLQQNR